MSPIMGLNKLKNEFGIKLETKNLKKYIFYISRMNFEFENIFNSIRPIIGESTELWGTVAIMNFTFNCLINS